MSLQNRLRGRFAKTESGPETIFGKCMNHYEDTKGKIYFVIRQNDNTLISMKENQKSIEAILTLGFETLEQLTNKNLYWRKESWVSEDGEKQGLYYVLYKVNEYTIIDSIPESIVEDTDEITPKKKPKKE